MKIKTWMVVFVCCSSLFFNLQAAELKMAYDADPLSLDPHEQLSAGTLQLSHLLFDPLIRWKKDYSFEPRLAESWQWVNDKTLRFHLRKEVKFHSGNPLTAEDVRWTFDRLKKSPDFKGVFAAIGVVGVIDNYTFDLITSQVYPLLFDNRAADIMMIGWHFDTEDSANFTEFLTACPDSVTGWGQYNSGHYCNSKVDQLVHLAGGESDSQKRAKLLQQVEQILYDDAAFVPLHWQNLAWAAVKNVKIAPVLNVMNFPFLGDLVIE